MKLLMFLLLPCLSLSEVGDTFDKCKKFFLNDRPPQFSPSQSNSQNPTANPPLLTLDSTVDPPRVSSTKHICQCLWDDDGQQKFLYATLYHTVWRIPVYSAYVFKSASTGRCDPWFIEPQLQAGVNNADPCKGPQGRNQAMGDHQALNRDYKGSDYDRGHLYPVQHTDNAFSMLATSTLTNAAPQDPGFNQNAWNDHEAAVITDLKDCDQAYVVTGVIPDLSKNIKNRVRVSKYYWRATCCLKNGVYTVKGYGPDYDNNGVMIVKKVTITELQDKLAKDYGVNVIIFSDQSTPPPRKKQRID